MYLYLLNIAWKFKENLSFEKKLWSIVYQNMHISENILSVADISRGVPKWKLSVAINWNMTVMQIK